MTWAELEPLLLDRRAEYEGAGFTGPLAVVLGELAFSALVAEVKRIGLPTDALSRDRWMGIPVIRDMTASDWHVQLEPDGPATAAAWLVEPVSK